MKSLFLTFCLLFSVSAFAQTTQTFSVQAEELPPNPYCRDQYFYLPVKGNNSSRAVTLEVKGDYEDVQSSGTVGDGYVHLTRCNVNKNTSKLPIKLTLIVKTQKRTIAVATDDENAEEVCQDFPFCPPPPELTTQSFSSFSSQVRYSRDGVRVWVRLSDYNILTIFLAEINQPLTLRQLRRKIR